MANTRWKIDELRVVTAAALEAADVQGPDSGRIRAVPDTRTIRYYTTLGLVDRPVEMRGRTAFYNRRHAMQLICIKRLQSDGLTLAEVQQRLAGASNQRLQAIGQVPKAFWESCQEIASEVEASPQSERRGASRQPADFWKTRPAPATSPVITHPQTRVRVPLGDDVVLEIPGDASAVEAVLPELARLAEPLIHQLQQWGIVGQVTSKRKDG